ncbi:MAG: degS [Bacillales bacterium]|jgi:two-component system sensor histidine kinase DegS|nr:degS [Bacillales bacterium]
MPDKMINNAQLDTILSKMIGTVEESKNQIFDINEQSRQFYQDLMKELELLRAEISEIIDTEELLHKKLKSARQYLSHVSSNFYQYTEKQIQKAYETANATQIEHVKILEREQNVRRRRDDIEKKLSLLSKTIERSEALITQISVILDYLVFDVKSMSSEIEESKQKQEFGLRLLEVQEEERKRISREIHDGPAQILAHVTMKADIIERVIQERTTEEAVYEVKQLRNDVQSALDEVRRIIYDIRPMALDDLGLMPTLRKYINGISERHNLDINFTVIGEELRMSPKLEIAIFRIVQEALNNIIKHARAKNAEVKIEIRDKIRLIIKDNGIGFNVNEIKKESFGLIGMEERLELLEGTIEIDSVINKGTTIFVQVPIIDGLS